MRTMTRQQGRWAGCFTMVMVAGLAQPLLAPFAPAAAVMTKEQQDEVRLTRAKLVNPLSDWTTINVTNDFVLLDGDFLDADDQWATQFQLATSIPIKIPRTESYWVSQLALPVRSVPRFDLGAFEFEQELGFGDLVWANLASIPLWNDAWILGVGPTLSFPSASSDATGSGKYQAGPAALFGYVTTTPAELFPGLPSPLWYLSVQQFWSFAGDSDRANTNLTVVQYFYEIGVCQPGSCLVPGLVTIGAAPYITADWKAPGSDVWSVPIGFGFFYYPLWAAEYIPFRVGFEADYYVARPDLIGPEWNVRVSITPYIPMDQVPNPLGTLGTLIAGD